jgi:hypothetical protein
LDAGDDAESGAELGGPELDGEELCAHAPTQVTSNMMNNQLRIELFYRLRRIAPNHPNQDRMLKSHH